nr:GNAT family N-acetyltransferase [Desulfobacula sp.]
MARKILNIAEQGQTVNIRHAVQSDLQGIAAIHIESWKDSYPDILPAEFLAGQIDGELKRHWEDIQIQEDDIVLVAEDNSLVGFAAVWCRPDPFIDNLHVRPSWRSKRIGSSLMKVVAAELIRKGHKTAFLWVFAGNENAIRFYERLGGVGKEQSVKNVFGYDVLSRKIEWDDLSMICEHE